MAEYNIYCDESCHLENDSSNVMVLGAIWCEKRFYYKITKEIQDIKERHGIPKMQEFKWHKVSATKLNFYKEILDYFFDEERLNFRVLTITDKESLDHERFRQTHDDFYYKIYFDMLKIIISPDSNYNIYMDIKDTQGYEKINKLHEVICKSHYDFSKVQIQKIQEVRSDEIAILQLTDVLIGVISYYNRGLETSVSKKALIDLVMSRSGYDLTKSTLPSEEKFNIFNWESGYGRSGL